MKIAQRRTQVAALYHAHLKPGEIAAQLGMCKRLVLYDLEALHAEWKTQAAAEIAMIKAEEIAFYYAQRASVLAEWEQTHNPRYMLLVIKWSERIALAFGLDAAVKQEIAIAPRPAEEMTDDELAAIARGGTGASGADDPPAA